MYSVKAYGFCKDDLELIENFNECVQDKDTIWHCHHRLETHDENGNLRDKEVSRKYLIEHNLYYHRPASELIFLTSSEHMRWHSNVKSRKNILKTYVEHNPDAVSKTMKEYYKEHPERLVELSEVMKKRYEDPEERQKVSEQQKKNYEEHPERKQKHSEAMKQYHQDHPELRQNLSQRMTELSKDPAFIQRVSDGVKKHFEEHPEARQAISNRLKGRKYSEEEYAAHQAQYEARRGTHLSEETKKKIGDSNRGTVRTEEYKQKMSESCKKVVHTEEWIKHSADGNRGKEHDKTNMKWFTNGVINYRGAECPEGFRPGKVNAKKNTSAIGSHWYTNGVDNIQCKECPEGYHRGRTVTK